MATRAGQRLGIQGRVTHLLTPQSLSTIYKAQVRSVMEYSPLAWMGAAPTTLKKLDPIQDKAAHLIGTISTNTHFLQYRRSVAAACTIYKMHCSNSPKILRQHLPNPRPLPSRRTRTADTWEHHHLQFTLQAIHHPDLEIYHHSFAVAGSKSWNSLPNGIVGQPTEHGLKRFKKAAHHTFSRATRDGQ